MSVEGREITQIRDARMAHEVLATTVKFHGEALPPDVRGYGYNIGCLALAYIAREREAEQSLRAALGKLAAEWREGNGDYPESLQDCADEIEHLLAQASNASSLAKELQAKPAAGTPTTEESK